MSTLEFILIVFLFTENVALLLVNHFDRQALERDGFGESAEAATRPPRRSTPRRQETHPVT